MPASSVARVSADTRAPSALGPLGCRRPGRNVPTVTATRKLVLIVIDGLTPSVFEHAVETGATPALALDVPLAHPRLRVLDRDRRTSRRAPHPAPRVVRPRRAQARRVRLVVRRAEGRRDAAVDHRHDLPDERTPPRRGRPHRLRGARRRGARDRRGQLHLLPRPFFYYSLFESDETGAPLAVRNRSAGSIDEYAAAVGRWLVTRDGFDFLVYYLSDYDYASHALGPEGAAGKLADADRAVGALLDAAGGPDGFLERY